MKKSVSLLLIAAFLMLLVSCTGNSYVISDTQDSTENSTETVIEETTDIPPQTEPTPDRILDDDGFVHTSSGVLCLDIEYSTAYKQLIKGVPIYLAYVKTDSFYVSHRAKALIPEKYTSYSLYYEYNEGKALYTMYLMLLSSEGGSAHAYIITYDAANDKCSAELKYNLLETRIASDGSFYAYLSTDVNGYAIDYDDKSPSCVIDKKFEFIVAPGTLEYDEYYPFVGRTDITAKMDEITEPCQYTTTVTADGKQYTENDSAVNSPFMNVTGHSWSQHSDLFDLFAKKNYSIIDRLGTKATVIQSTFDFEIPDYSRASDNPNTYVYLSRYIDGEDYLTVVDSDGDNIYYGCSHNGKIIVEPIYTSISYSSANSYDNCRYMILSNENGATIVKQKAKRVEICSFDGYVNAGNLIYVKRSDGKWGTVSPSNDFNAYDFIFDDIKYDGVAIFTCHDENGEVYYRINNADEKSALLESEGYRIKAKTTSGEEYYIVKVNSDLYKIIYD